MSIRDSRVLIPVIVGIFALLIGLVVGSSGKHDTPVAAAKPVPAVTKTVTETVETVPQSCLDALDEADQGFSIAADMIGKYSDGISQITSNQIIAAYQTIADIKGLNSNLDDITPQYVSNKDACRTAGTSS